MPIQLEPILPALGPKPYIYFLDEHGFWKCVHKSIAIVIRSNILSIWYLCYGKDDVFAFAEFAQQNLGSIRLRIWDCNSKAIT